MYTHFICSDPTPPFQDSIWGYCGERGWAARYSRASFSWGEPYNVHMDVASIIDSMHPTSVKGYPRLLCPCVNTDIDVYCMYIRYSSM